MAPPCRLIFPKSEEKEADFDEPGRGAVHVKMIQEMTESKARLNKDGIAWSLPSEIDH